MLLSNLGALWALLAAPAGAPLGLNGLPQQACSATANLAARAAEQGARNDLLLRLANCVNLIDAVDASGCLDEAWVEYRQALDEAGAIYQARLDICAEVGEAPYHPIVDPGSFQSDITNPYAPFVPGSFWAYEGITDQGLERIETTVLEERKWILGVECTVVRSVETLNGVVKEDTVDWYAQDLAGNVWYFGERALLFSNGEPVDFEGSWQSGTAGAKPGILMPATAELGQMFRMEFLLSEAEDVATILAEGVTVEGPLGVFRDTRLVANGSPLDPEEDEDKFHARGVGLVLEVEKNTGRTIELVEYVPAAPR